MALSNETLVLAKKYARQVGAGNFVDMVFNSRDESSGLSTYIMTFVKDGVNTSYAVQFKDGKKGDNGKDGLSIKKVVIDGNAHLITTFSDDSTIDGGAIQQLQVNQNLGVAFTSLQWQQDAVDTTKYNLTLEHKLNNVNINCSVYDSNNILQNVGIKIVDVNTVKLDTTTPFTGKIVINYSSGAGGGTISTISINGVTASSFTIDKTVVGLSNVKNLDTTNASNISTGTLGSARLPIATTSTVGGVKVGNGLNVDSEGLTTAKIGLGLKFDGTYTILVDTANVDVTQLKNFSSIVTGSPKGFFGNSATLATFANGSKGDFYIFNGTSGFALGGCTFNTGDQLWVTTTFTGTPANLTTNHSYVANTVSQATTTSYGTVKLGSATPLMDSSTASTGTSTAMAREDHVHPSDTNKINKIASSTNNAIVTWSGTTGNTLADSAKNLPTGAIVGTTDTQILDNKSMNDGTTYIQNSTDATKKLKFDNSLITTNTTRTLTAPNRSGTIALALSVVNLTTLGNITLQNNSIYEITNVAVATSTLTLPSGTTTGDIIQILVPISGFSDSTYFTVAGNINGTASNSVVNNRSFVEYKFIWSATMSTWILASSSQGY